MRLFIALDFEDVSDYLKLLQEKVPEAKAAYPTEFHLTLKFLGEVDDSKVDGIKEKLKGVNVEPMQMKLGKTGIFPNENFIRVVWVGFDDGKKVEELQQSIEDALSGMFEKDSRFHPHITLARIKFIENEKKKEFVEAVKAIQVEPKEATLTKFKLIKSTLTKTGPVYEVLEEYG